MTSDEDRPLRDIILSSSSNNDDCWLDTSTRQLKLRTDQAKEEVYEMIAAHKSQFSQTFDAGREIESQVNFVSQSLREIEKFSRDEEGEVKSAMRNHENTKKLNVQIEKTKNAIEILRGLKSVHGHFKDVDSALEVSDSVSAASKVSTLHTEMKRLSEKLNSAPEKKEKVSASRLLRYLRVKFRQKRSLVRDRLSEDFASMLSVVRQSSKSATQQQESSSSGDALGMIVLRTKRSKDEKQQHVSSKLVQVLSALRTVGKLDDLLTLLLNDLDRIFFNPLTRTSSSSSSSSNDKDKQPVTLQVKRSKRRDGDYDRITLSLIQYEVEKEDEDNDEDQDSCTFIDRMFGNLNQVLQFIFKDVLGENKTIAKAIGRSLWRRKGGNDENVGLEMRCLNAMRETLPSICSARRMTSAQKWLKRETNRFLETVSLYYSNNEKDPSLLLNFVDDLPEHLTKTRRRKLLREARDMIRQDRMFESTTVVQSESSVQSQSLLQQLRDSISSDSLSSSSSSSSEGKSSMLEQNKADGYFSFPQCRVTDCARKLVSLSREALQEATSWSLDSCSRTLLLTARDVIDLYRAIAPVAHERALSSDTRIPMLLHNDCIFLAHHALFVAHMFREGLPETLRPVATLVDLVPPLRRMAEDAYVQLIERQQRRVLNDFVGFEKVVASWDNSSSSSSLQKKQVVDEVDAELCVKRVVDVIEQLSLDWSDVLPQSVHIHSIARLAELVANRALDSIMALRSVNMTAIPKLLHAISLLLSLDSRLKKIELKSESTQWYALCQVFELLSEYRAHSKAEARSKSMKELGEARTSKVLRLLSKLKL